MIKEMNIFKKSKEVSTKNSEEEVQRTTKKKIWNDITILIQHMKSEKLKL